MHIPGYATLEDLEKDFGVSFSEKEKLEEILKIHPMYIPDYYARLINWNDPKDPIKKIIFPSLEELDLTGSYDTGGELADTVLTGLQHKLRETVLLLVTNRCAGYCRHCFRKRMVGISTSETIKIFDDALEYIKKHPEVTNILISGGDPLVLDTEVIEYFLSQLSQVPHLKFIRIGSRMPVFYPMRIYEDTKLLEIFKRFSTPERRLYLVTHFNHPKEITEEAKKAVDALLGCKVSVGNQTVLLRGVNDSAEVLSTLMKELIRIGVIPYYVFQCRPVKRVKKGFQVPLKEAYSIVEGAKQMLDGHAKRFRYVMSHKTGKIEIVGIMGDEIYLKYHQAKDPEVIGILFKRRLTPESGWLDDLEVISPDDPGQKLIKKYYLN